MNTFASLFSGGGGADIGAIAAGFAPLWAVEYDAAIAGVYRANLGDHIIVDDVCNVDYATLPRVDWLHASPVCTRYSVANSQRGESDLDIVTAQATARAIESAQPRYVTIENVQQYAGSDALRLITATLDRLGYWWHAEVMNSADYGVPQTRRRLIVRASLDMLRPMPQAQRWIGWYEAIEDLIPTLPPSKFTPWQTARLPKKINKTTLFSNHCGTDGYTTLNRVESKDPSFSVAAHIRSVNAYRAWLSTGRVIQMSPRALARFQSFPDAYALPDKAALACRVIGNAVPPLLMQTIGGSW
jgi:DNA (cytosine-5)-methyltransferase 1